MKINPSPSFSIELTVESTLSRPALEEVISAAEGICALSEGTESPFRFVAYARDSKHQEAIIQALESAEGTTVLSADEITYRSHLGGKIETLNKMNLAAPGAMSIAYTPGVGRV